MSAKPSFASKLFLCCCLLMMISYTPVRITILLLSHRLLSPTYQVLLLPFPNWRPLDLFFESLRLTTPIYVAIGLNLLDSSRYTTEVNIHPPPIPTTATAAMSLKCVSSNSSAVKGRAPAVPPPPMPGFCQTHYCADSVQALQVLSLQLQWLCPAQERAEMAHCHAHFSFLALNIFFLLLFHRGT